MTELARNVSQVGRFERHELPNGSAIYFEPDRHGYFGEVKASKSAKGGYSFVRDSRLPGVSTVSKALDAGNNDALLAWAARVQCLGIADLVSADPENLGWLDSQDSIIAALRDAELTFEHVRERAATRGTNVHERIFLALATGGRIPSLSGLSSEERGYGQAALKWWNDRNPTPLFAEQVTYSAEHAFGGRFDLVCDLGDGPELWDAKTREKPRTYRGDHAQLRGYEIANRECGIGESVRQVALVLLPWGDYHEVECAATDADFLAALNTYRRGADLEKRMRAQAKAAKEAVPA